MAARVGEYLLFETLGHGAFGEVKAGVHAASGTSVAVKVMNKDTIKAQDMSLNVRREVAILKTLKHRNVVGLHAVLSSKRNVYVVLDMVDGGELFDRIEKSNARGLPECEARNYFRQLVTGVSHCHAHGVVHRDLKPENLLIDNHTGDLRIADFGLSAIKGAGNTSELLQTRAGTPNYLPPEAISNVGEGYNGEKLDAWACGIILYALLAGFLPFDEPDINQLFRAIRSGRVEYPSWFSKSAISLISNLLNIDSRQRYSIQEAQNHAWLDPHSRRKEEVKQSHRVDKTAPAARGIVSQRNEEDYIAGNIDRAASIVQGSQHEISKRSPTLPARSYSLLRSKPKSEAPPSNMGTQVHRTAFAPTRVAEHPLMRNQRDQSVLRALRHLQSVIAISRRDSRAELSLGHDCVKAGFQTFERIASGVNSKRTGQSTKRSETALHEKMDQARFAEERSKTLWAVREIREYISSTQRTSSAGTQIPTKQYDIRQRSKLSFEEFEEEAAMTSRLLDVWEIRVLNEGAMNEGNTGNSSCSVSEEELLVLQHALGKLDDTIVGHDAIASDIQTETGGADSSNTDAQKLFSFMEKRASNSNEGSRRLYGDSKYVCGASELPLENVLRSSTREGISGNRAEAMRLMEAQHLRIPLDPLRDSRAKSPVFAFAQESAEQATLRQAERVVERRPRIVNGAHPSPKSANAILREQMSPNGLASANAIINAAVDIGAIPAGGKVSLVQLGGPVSPENGESVSNATRDRLRVSIKSPSSRNRPTVPVSPREDGYGSSCTGSADLMSSTLRRKSTSSKSTNWTQEWKRTSRENYRNGRKSFGHWTPGAHKKGKLRDLSYPPDCGPDSDQKTEKREEAKEVPPVQSKSRLRWFSNSKGSKTESSKASKAESSELLTQFGTTTSLALCLVNLKIIADSLGCEVVPKERSSAGWERMLLRVPSGRYIPPLAIGIVAREHEDIQLGIKSAVVFSIDADATSSTRTGMARFLEDLKAKCRTEVSGFLLVDL